MTPKEKAKELVKKFICIDISLEADNIDYEMLECELGYNPKEFALVAVDEIINENESVDWWFLVKKEIEKL